MPITQLASSPDNYQIAKGKAYFRPYDKVPAAYVSGAAVASGTYVSTTRGGLYKVMTGGNLNTGAAPTGTGTGITHGTAVLDYVDWVFLGNAPKVEWNSEVELKEHFSSTEGTKTRDLQAVLTRKGSVAVTLDEVTPYNLMIATMGKEYGASGAIEVFANAQSMGQFRFDGTNDVGRKQNWYFGYARFQPGKALPLVGDDFTQIEMTADVGKDEMGVFGIITPVA